MPVGLHQPNRCLPAYLVRWTEQKGIPRRMRVELQIVNLQVAGSSPVVPALTAREARSSVGRAGRFTNSCRRSQGYDEAYQPSLTNRPGRGVTAAFARCERAGSGSNPDAGTKRKETRPGECPWDYIAMERSAERRLTILLSPGPNYNRGECRRNYIAHPFRAYGCSGSTPGLCERPDGKRAFARGGPPGLFLPFCRHGLP